MILREEPYAAVLEPIFRVNHCSHCLRKTSTPIPCFECATVSHNNHNNDVDNNNNYNYHNSYKTDNNNDTVNAIRTTAMVVIVMCSIF